MKKDEYRSYVEMLKTYKDIVDADIDLEYYKKMLRFIEHDTASFVKKVVNEYQGRKRWLLVYLAMIIDIVKGNFGGINDRMAKIGIPVRERMEFRQWLQKNKPGVYEKLKHYKKRIEKELAEAIRKLVADGRINEEYTLGILTDKFTLMADTTIKLLEMKELLMEKIGEKLPEVVELYATEMANQVGKTIKQIFDEMLDQMKDEVVKTRVLLMKANMMAIVGYYNGLLERMPKGKVSFHEARNAWEIFKTELGEPLSITEEHNKSVNVIVNVPLDNQKIEPGKNLDLDLEIADKFKQIVEKKLKQENEEVKALTQDLEITKIEIDDQVEPARVDTETKSEISDNGTTS